MLDLGIVRPGSTIRIPFSSFDKDDGSSITMTNYAAADILVYKDGSTTERASTSGFTATTDFDTKTGKHLAIIDLSDNTTAGFWNAGSEYLVAIDAVTIDAVTTGGWIARFRIGYPDAVLDTTIATLASQTSFTLTTGPAEDSALVGSVVIIHDIASAVQMGYGLITAYTGASKTVTLAAGTTFTAAAGDNISVMPRSDLSYILGIAVSTTTAQLGVNAVQAGGTAWNSGAIKTTSFTAGAIDNAAIATDAIGAAEIADNAIDAGAIATGAITAAKFAAGAIDAAAIATGAIDADALAADAGTEIAAAVWDMDATAHQTQGTFGQAIGDPVADTNTIYNAVVTDAAGATVGVDTTAIAGYVDTEVASTLAAVDTEVADIRTRVLLALPAVAPAANGGLPTVNASNYIAGIAGTKNTLDNLNDLSAAQVNAEVDTALDTAVPGSPTANSINERIKTMDDANIPGRLPAALSGGKMDSVADIVSVNGDTTTAAKLEAALDGTVTGSVNDAAATTTAFVTTLGSAVNDYYKNRIITFTSGALAGQQREITAYTGATKTVTVAALTSAPANGVTFVVT